MENGKFHKTKVSMCVLCKVSKKEKFYNKFFIIVSFTFHYTKIAFFIQKIEFFCLLGKFYSWTDPILHTIIAKFISQGLSLC